MKGSFLLFFLSVFMVSLPRTSVGHKRVPEGIPSWGFLSGKGLLRVGSLAGPPRPTQTKPPRTRVETILHMLIWFFIKTVFA